MASMPSSAQLPLAISGAPSSQPCPCSPNLSMARDSIGYWDWAGDSGPLKSLDGPVFSPCSGLMGLICAVLAKPVCGLRFSGVCGWAESCSIVFSLLSITGPGSASFIWSFLQPFSGIWGWAGSSPALTGPGHSKLLGFHLAYESHVAWCWMPGAKLGLHPLSFFAPGAHSSYPNPRVLSISLAYAFPGTHVWEALPGKPLTLWVPSPHRRASWLGEHWEQWQASYCLATTPLSFFPGRNLNVPQNVAFFKLVLLGSGGNFASCCKHPCSWTAAGPGTLSPSSVFLWPVSFLLIAALLRPLAHHDGAHCTIFTE